MSIICRTMWVVIFSCVVARGEAGLGFLAEVVSGPCSPPSCGTIEGFRNCVISTANYKGREKKSLLRQRTERSAPSYGNSYGYGGFQQFSYGYGNIPSYYPQQFVRQKPQQAIYHPPSPEEQQRRRERQGFLQLLNPGFISQNTKQAARLFFKFIYENNRCGVRGSCPNTDCYQSFCQNVCGQKLLRGTSEETVQSRRRRQRTEQLCQTPDSNGKQMRFFCHLCTPFFGEDYLMLKGCRPQPLGKRLADVDTQNSREDYDTLPDEETKRSRNKREKTDSLDDDYDESPPQRKRSNEANKEEYIDDDDSERVNLRTIRSGVTHPQKLHVPPYRSQKKFRTIGQSDLNDVI